MAKSNIPYDPTYMTFCKEQSYRNGNQINGLQDLRVWKGSYKRIWKDGVKELRSLAYGDSYMTLCICKVQKIVYCSKKEVLLYINFKNKNVKA
jgi:hypothetical protein